MREATFAENSKTSSSKMAAQPVPSPLTGFKRLNASTYIYEPPTSPSPASSSAPDLILLPSWLDAAPRHIAKYTRGYQALYPSARILLITTAVAARNHPHPSRRGGAPRARPLPPRFPFPEPCNPAALLLQRRRLHLAPPRAPLPGTHRTGSARRRANPRFRSGARALWADCDCSRPGAAEESCGAALRELGDAASISCGVLCR